MRVIATTQGYDNIAVREPGEEFDMPDTTYDAVPVLDDKGRPTGKTEPPNHPWFKKVSGKETAKDLV